MAQRMWIVLAALAGAAAAQEPQKAGGYLGVQVGPVDTETRAAFAIPAAIAEGVVILDAMPGTPAAKAGIQRGDVLVQFAGAPVRTPDELIALVRARAPGDEVAYVVRRGDGTIDGRLKLAASPPRAPPTEVTLEERLDRVQRDIELLDRKLRKGPRTLAEWLDAETRKAAAARERGDREAVHRAEIRIELLKEMEREGVRGTAERLDRIEGKLDRILERLGER